MKNKTDFEEKYELLRELNVLYVIKSISISEFVQKMSELDDSIIKEANKIVKKETGRKKIRQTRF